MTKIEWVKNPDGTQGITVNAKTGCLNGCPYCYARKLANGRLKRLYLNRIIWDTLKPSYYQGYPNLDPFYPRWWPERLEKIKDIIKPTGIFLDDMSDWAADYWPEECTQAEMETIKTCPRHRFYLLTKQPQELHKFSPFPDNCWVGVSVCNDKMLDIAVDKLEDIQAKHKFISFEPLLERITLSLDYAFYYSGISWVIIGAQTPYSEKTAPRKEWVGEIVDSTIRCNNIPVFLKDNLRPVLKAVYGEKLPMLQEIPDTKTPIYRLAHQKGEK